MSERSPILFFVKAPVEGRVKSRLAASLGETAALELYRHFALDIIDTLDKSGHEVIIFFDPPDAADSVSRWLGRNRASLPQEGSDLGSRMEHAFRSVFSTGASRAVLIGSDFPDLPSKILTEALDALERHDAVIGPTADGGYYLIGFQYNAFRPEVFRNVQWSTSAVFDTTMRLFIKSGLHVHQLPPWRDVDTVEDLFDLLARNKGTPFERSRTMPILRTVCGNLEKA